MKFEKEKCMLDLKIFFQSLRYDKLKYHSNDMIGGGHSQEDINCMVARFTSFWIQKGLSKNDFIVWLTDDYENPLDKKLKNTLLSAIRLYYIETKEKYTQTTPSNFLLYL